MNKNDPTVEYIEYICGLYGDVYDDRIEDCKPPTAGIECREPGADWVPGQTAYHKSLVAFQKELEDKGIKLSSSKIRKILITGGCWSTERSREIEALFNNYIQPKTDHGLGLQRDAAINKIASDLKISVVTVSVNLPYESVVYKLEHKSSNAIRCAKYRAEKNNA
ncbi:hypothetical protein [Butyrivibrio sp. AE2032]|uniref:hypothetical protein n=1 Tax=Butyrivibrio sp. AE2032 TaxID=1458463 RepID=UPI00054E4F67|nr:hypothetical protein [Butyrivibrio sp. AE2032]